MDKKLMIWIIIGILIVATFLIIKNVNSNVSGDVITEGEIKNLHRVNLAIKGMSCEGCAYGVKAQIEELEGVVNAEINYKTGIGVVLYDADKIDAETIAVASTVYPAKVIEDSVIN